MTEADWNAAADPESMLTWLREKGRLPDRKARLFAVACCRRVWPLLTDERLRTAVSTAEDFGDGVAGEEVLAAARDAVGAIDGGPWGGAAWEAALSAAEASALSPAVGAAARAAKYAAYVPCETAPFAPAAQAVRAGERRAQAALLRDLAGNPFRPRRALSPSLLDWHDGLVVQLAQAIYAERAFTPERLGVLADALEEAGCTDAELLGHLRGPGPHAGRGCWAIDLILGKE